MVGLAGLLGALVFGAAGDAGPLLCRKFKEGFALGPFEGVSSFGCLDAGLDVLAVLFCAMEAREGFFVTLFGVELVFTEVVTASVGLAGFSCPGSSSTPVMTLSGLSAGVSFWGRIDGSASDFEPLIDSFKAGFSF